MTAALQMGYWKTVNPVPVTLMSSPQLYSFNSLQTLLIPYLLCLFLSIPFLYLGVRSLRLNGASAIEGGFIQIVMTTSGSKALEKASASGCLGGDENVPEELKEMKIRFGALATSSDYHDSGPVQERRAGFGTDDEVLPLQKGVTYGA